MHLFLEEYEAINIETQEKEE